MGRLARFPSRGHASDGGDVRAFGHDSRADGDDDATAPGLH